MRYKKVEVANIDLELRTEVIDEEELDTEVTLSGNVFVSGNEKENFIAEFEQLINRFRI